MINSKAAKRYSKGTSEAFSRTGLFRRGIGGYQDYE